MSTNYVASLRAIANHVKKHSLDDGGTLGIDFGKHHDVEVQAYGQEAFRAWHRTLKDVTAQAQRYNDDHVIVDVTGHIVGATVRVRYYATLGHETDVHDAVLSLLTRPESREFEAIELPEILTKAPLAGGER